jgi:hypothetical protein
MVMMAHAVRLLLAASLLTVSLLHGPPPALADDPPPPAVGATILEDSLTVPSAILPMTCPSRRGGTEYVSEGLRISVAGSCFPPFPVAGAGPTIRGLTFRDGEIRLEVKAVSGLERIRFNINVRQQPFPPGPASLENLPGSDSVAIEPGLGQALVGRVGKPDSFKTRADLAGTLSADGWNTVAIRVQGQSFWLLLNDEPILVGADDMLDQGAVAFSVLRLSDTPNRIQADPNDTTEVAVVVRNLRVSALAGGDPARAPAYQLDGLPPAPQVGATVLEDALTTPGLLQPSTCPTGRGGGAFVGEGYLMKVVGLCYDGSSTAGFGVRFEGLAFSDGEARLEMKPVSAVERVRFSLEVRGQPSGGNWYYGAIEPSTGGAQILKLTNNQGAALDQRFDLATVLSPNDWNTLAIRARGPELWLLVNDRPVLHTTTDGAFDVGGVSLTLRRLGDLNDVQEVAAVVRNLRVSALADGESGRVPTYQRP